MVEGMGDECRSSARLAKGHRRIGAPIGRDHAPHLGLKILRRVVRTAFTLPLAMSLLNIGVQARPISISSAILRVHGSYRRSFNEATQRVIHKTPRQRECLWRRFSLITFPGRGADLLPYPIHFRLASS
jgi:hypothetical protein